jgi:predicted RNase H-like nuclease (RuvC/YqgF family)
MADYTIIVDTTQLDKAIDKAEYLTKLYENPAIKRMIDIQTNDYNKLKKKHKKAGRKVAELISEIGQLDKLLYNKDRMIEKLSKEASCGCRSGITAKYKQCR